MIGITNRVNEIRVRPDPFFGVRRPRDYFLSNDYDTCVLRNCLLEITVHVTGMLEQRSGHQVRGPANVPGGMKATAPGMTSVSRDTMQMLGY